MVARVGDQRLTLCDFARRMNLQNPYLRARFNNPEARRALLQSWVEAELLAAEAHDRGFDQDPEVHRAVTMRLARALELEIRSAVPAPTVTDGEVRAYYEAHRSEYETEAQARASQIVLATRADAERVLTDARNHSADDTYFRALVRRVSLDPVSRAADGDLAFFPRTGGPGVAPEVAAVAFTLTNTGEFADHVVESAHGGPGHGPGFHVVRLTARRDALRRTLEEESRRIRNRLLREKRDAAEEAAVRAEVERLHRAATVQVDEAALAQVHVEPAPATVAPMLPPFLNTPPGLTQAVERATATPSPSPR